MEQNKSQMTEDKILINQILDSELPNKRLERIFKTVLSDGEKALSPDDFDYYCINLPEIIRKLVQS